MCLALRLLSKLVIPKARKELKILELLFVRRNDKMTCENIVFYQNQLMFSCEKDLLSNTSYIDLEVTVNFQSRWRCPSRPLTVEQVVSLNK